MKKISFLFLSASLLLTSCKNEDYRINFVERPISYKIVTEQLELDYYSYLKKMMYKIAPIVFKAYEGKTVSFTIIDFIVILSSLARNMVNSGTGNDKAREEILQLLEVSSVEELEKIVLRILDIVCWGYDKTYNAAFVSPLNNNNMDKSAYEENLKFLAEEYRLQLFKNSNNNLKSYSSFLGEDISQAGFPEKVEDNSIISHYSFGMPWRPTGDVFNLFYRGWVSNTDQFKRNGLFNDKEEATFLIGDLYNGSSSYAEGSDQSDFTTALITDTDHNYFQNISTQFIVPKGETTPEILSTKLQNIEDSLVKVDSKFEFPMLNINSVIDIKSILEPLGLGSLQEATPINQVDKNFNLSSWLQFGSLKLDRYGINAKPFELGHDCVYGKKEPNPELPQIDLKADRPFLLLLSYGGEETRIPFSITQVYNLK